MSYRLDNNYALLIGVGECIDSSWSLSVTVKDVEDLKSVLTDSCGYISDEQHIRLLSNQTATKEKILEGLNWLKEKTQQDSEATVIVYYSGHGKIDRVHNKYYLVPHDNNNLISAEEFDQGILEIKAKQLLVVVDSCHAGGMVKSSDQNNSISTSFPADDLLDKLELSKLKKGEGKAVFTSSKGNQPSWIFSPHQNSIYTHHFLEALKGHANKPGDEVVYVSDLMGYLTKKVKESALKRGKEQTPYFKILGDNFPVALYKEPVALYKENYSSQINSGNQEDFYLDPNVIKSCQDEILKPGCLLRIKAPRQMGKTELMRRIESFAANQGYHTVVLSLRSPEEPDFQNLEKFLKWFCSIIASNLKLNLKIEEDWHKRLGNNKHKCETFFEDYFLKNRRIRLFLDDLDKVFNHENIAGDFLSLIRVLNEKARNHEIWKRFGLVIVYTETYNKLNINQSPLNIGKEINANNLELDEDRVQKLAKMHKLDLNIGQIQQLMNMVGGHPYLIEESFKKLKQPNTKLEELLENACINTEDNIYRQHLIAHINKLQTDSELLSNFKKVILAENPVQSNSELNSEYIEKLTNLGLIKRQSNSAIPRYELYRQYFQNYFNND